MKIVLFILLSLAFIGPAFGQEARLSWDAPTTRVDGTELDPATEIDRYTLTCYSDTDERSTPIPATAAGSTYTVSKAEIIPGYGVYDCYLTATDTDGLTSDPSNTVKIEREKTRPDAPTNILLITE